eukprot:10677418-Alexandrium_andersonii.AAC.1
MHRTTKDRDASTRTIYAGVSRSMHLHQHQPKGAIAGDGDCRHSESETLEDSESPSKGGVKAPSGNLQRMRHP